MRKTIIISIVSALVAAGAGVGITLLATGGDDQPLTVATDAPVVTADVVVTPPTDDGGTQSQPTNAPPATQAPQTQAPSNGTAAPGPSTPSKAAADVNCGSEPHFCSKDDGTMTLNQDEELVSESTKNVRNYDTTKYAVITMDSKIETTGGGTAKAGDRVTQLVVDVEVHNTTNRTFLYSARDIAMKIVLDGAPRDTLNTKGAGFEMPPGGKLNATFKYPVTKPGEYKWWVQTWYAQK